MEPLSIFGRELNRAAVLHRLRKLAGRVETDSGRDDDWTAVTATFGGGFLRKAKTLTLSYSPDYCSEPNWTRQMDGMRGYFSRVPQTGAQQRTMLLIRSFRFTLGTTLEPEAERPDDARVQAVFSIAEALNAVVFTPSALRDAKGLVLFAVDGSYDRNARWPPVWIGPPDRLEEDDEDFDEGDPPSAERVAARVLALAALTARALSEDDAYDPDPQTTMADIREWASDSGAEAEMEAEEREVLQALVGALDRQAQVNAVWRIEGLAVLLWALGRGETAPHDQVTDARTMWLAAGLLDHDATREVLDAPVLRPRDELEAMRERLFAIHWRMTEFRLRPGTLDFVDLAVRMPWLSAAAVRELPLVDDDLAIGGIRIDRAPPDAVRTTASIAVERHLAINWLCDGPEIYSATDVST